MLSPQTKDEATAKVMAVLQENDLSVEMIDAIDESHLETLLYGVSFHKTKAKYGIFCMK